MKIEKIKSHSISGLEWHVFLNICKRIPLGPLWKKGVLCFFLRFTSTFLI